MRHRNATNKLSRPSGHRRALLRNLATALITEGSIRTTQAKAKVLRPHVEHLITLARRGDQHAQRQAFAELQDKAAVKKLFTQIGPEQRSRPGGYTRITKVGHRCVFGDAAPMAVIEIIGPAPGEAPKAKPKRRRRTGKKTEEAE